MTELNKNIFDLLGDNNTKSTTPLVKRPMSAVTRSTANSKISIIPEVSRMKLT